MMNEMRKLMEAVKQLDESTRQEVAGWEDYDPEKVSDPDKWEWETDPKILAYDEENRRLQKELFDEEQLGEAAGGVQVSMIIVDDDEVYVSEEVRSITPDQAGDFIELCINAVFGGGRYEGVDSDSIIEALQELGLTKEPEGEDEEDY